MSGNYDQRYGGDGAAGGGNTVNDYYAGEGGKGAEANGLVNNASTLEPLSASDVALYISAGNGGRGVHPASRPAVTGMSGAIGGGGGGAWKNGTNGAQSSTPGAGVNGVGGNGGVGGRGIVWIMPLSAESQKTR